MGPQDIQKLLQSCNEAALVNTLLALLTAVNSPAGVVHTVVDANCSELNFPVNSALTSEPEAPPSSGAVLVFTIFITVIDVFADTVTGVSKVRKVNRPHTDHK